MLFAEQITDWRSAVVALLVIIANVVANWYQNRAIKAKVTKAADDATAAAQTATTQAATTHSLLNGDGIMGALKKHGKSLDRIEVNQKSHDAKDDRRFAAVYERLGLTEDAQPET